MHIVFQLAVGIENYKNITITALEVIGPICLQTSFIGLKSM